VIPKRTNRAHLRSSNLRCDTVTVLNMAARHDAGQRFADMNACALKDGDANVHWPDNPVKNHYDHIWTGERNLDGSEVRRPMTDEEREKHLIDTTTEEFLSWRRSMKGGPHPATVAMRQQEAIARDVIICWELKSRAYQRSEDANRFVLSVTESGHIAYYMTLVTMAFWGQKLTAFKLAGGETALLAHGVTKTKAIADKLVEFEAGIDRIWGDWAT
jgi:hypothetical protein